MAFFALMEVTMSKYFIDSCQCPERSCFISTPTKVERNIRHEMFQRPKRALFISTDAACRHNGLHSHVFQRPKRALFISTLLILRRWKWNRICFNALNGLTSFLQDYIKARDRAEAEFQRPKRALFISTITYFQTRSESPVQVSTP